VIEHNLDVIKTADYIIDLGPEGGDRGGTVVASGTPEEVAECEGSYTGVYINKELKKAAERKNREAAAEGSGREAAAEGQNLEEAE
jgi:excinuclease ABC subunit A